MNSLIKKILMIIILANIKLYAEETDISFGMFNLRSIGGKIGLESLYRSKEVKIGKGIHDFPKALEYSGIFNLNTTSYLWHPNFLLIDVNLEYNPGSYSEMFLVVPDRSDARTAERIDFRATFFQQRQITLSFFSSYGHSFINREFSSNQEFELFSWGGVFTYNNSFLPIYFNYTESKSNQLELATLRTYINNRNIFSAMINKSFSLHKHKLNISHSFIERNYFDVAKTKSVDLNAILTNQFFLTSDKKNIFRSTIGYYTNRSIQDLKRITAYENISIKLPENLTASGNYNFTRVEQNNKKADLSTVLNQHDATGRLVHQLYLSLNSYASFQFTDTRHTGYNENRSVADIGFRYKKLIPTGLLRLNYNFSGLNQVREGYSIPLIISDEKYILNDFEAILLKNPGIDKNSIVVTDVTQTIIYVENIDYILIKRSNFIEIQRLPGGQIDIGKTVYIDYTSDASESYAYNSITHGFGGSITLFDNFFEVYMNGIEQDFNNIEGEDFVTLQLISKRTYGSKISIGYFSGGLEYENYKSNIVPYKSMRYFITLNRKFGDTFMAQITGNYKDYELIHENEKQKFADISGKMQYVPSRLIKFTLDGGYRFQEGRGLDLKLLTIRFETAIFYRQTNFRIGVETYDRVFVTELINYVSGFLKIERKF